MGLSSINVLPRSVSSRSAVCQAVLLSLMLSTTSLTSFAQSDEDDAIEEVVTTGTRLKGSAAAVLQERQNQAFVADILGADQISRTGDSDAAGALRRVTGLTLVDGKFIYVRGLGERYSSTQLNGMGVPSPDPTRSVVPLDLFPADIIESLSVQKSFSPDMPAHFGGGNVNVRTKTIPNDFVFRVSGSIGSNTNNSEDGQFYSGGGQDWSGRDDGTRGLPAIIYNNLEEAQSDDGIEGGANFPLNLVQRQQLLNSMYWDIGPEQKSLDPDFGIGATLGNIYDIGDESQIGFLSTLSYDNSWKVEDQFNGTNLGTVGCADLPEEDVNDGKCFAQSFEGIATEQQVNWSAMFNVGYEYDSNNRIEITNVLLHDMRDRVRVRDFVDVNETVFGDTEFTRVDMLFEERRMNSNQIKGTHNFPKLANTYFDWYYGTSRARRQQPGSLDLVYQLNFDNGVFESQQLQDVSATAVQRDFQTLRDVSDSGGWNFGYPIFASGLEFEFKAGADFFSKARTADNLSIDVPHRAIADAATFGDRINEIFSPENLLSAEFYQSASGAGILESGVADGDKFAAGTKIDAFYMMADAFIDNTWRISGGVRYEDFRQISVPFTAHANTFSIEGEEIEEIAFQEDDFFPSLALTYLMDAQMQFRLNISQTAIRPDLRDISTTFFIDPLTEFLVRGSPLLQSSKLDNIDFRWEWYKADGNNVSVALFYKDIETPIELVELGTVGGAAPNLLTANGESGELYGVEMEFLQDLNFISDKLANFYMSGNLTLSDSEVTLGAVDDDEISLFEEQLLDALDATSASNIVTNNTRRLVGHSEWVANLQLGYDSDNGEHTATLVYNAFGPRIIVPGTRGNQDAEEETFHSLDLIYTYFPNFKSSLKISVKNILNQDKQITQEGLNLLFEEEGISFSLGYSWEF
ncbi:TonB-dependent receptor domain-containing protein [Ningiella sp. W23]|uniref:TonB-dependent receptor domain-containing protein n=1 Tax=Ningiella sp. W23 TaxID=3023715 RepID=UPI003758490F